jgi:hypothetical protein
MLKDRMRAEVEIAAGTARLRSLLAVPSEASGIVVFAHGSGSSRRSPRNQYLASVLRGARLGTGAALAGRTGPARKAAARPGVAAGGR